MGQLVRRAVAGLSVPHAGRGPAHRIELFRNIYKDRFFYQLYFQQPGVAEAEFETDVRASLRKIYYAASGEGRKAAPRPAKIASPARICSGGRQAKLNRNAPGSSRETAKYRPGM